MFEDSTFESTGRIRTRSRGWMMAAFVFNSSILLALILIPLIYPEALPRQWMSVLIEAPTPPPVKPKPAVQPTRERFHGAPQFDGATLVAPRIIPIHIARYEQPEAPPSVTYFAMDGDSDAATGVREAFRGANASVIRGTPQGPVRVTSRIAEGMLLQKVMPVYPPIAKVTRKEGTVMLQATISTSGLIENLRVLSGDQMLTQAALDAVRNWRYRPYLLNGQPVEVETTINVIFKLTQ
jgi:periplasmic protein TonB